MGTEELLFALLRAAVCGEAVEDKTKDACTPDMLEAAYALARRHDLAHLVGQAASKLGLSESESLAKCKQAAMRAFMRYMQMNYSYEQICAALEEERTPFIPLKGSVLRDDYPEQWMRTSCDIDILIHESDLDKAIGVLTEKLGYINKGRSYHDVSLFSPNGIHLELHFDTIEEGTAKNDCRAVLSEVWECARPKEGKQYQMDMSDEMFCFYHIAHMAKHLTAGGCGIRPFLDLWILNHNVAHDRQRREMLLARGGLLTFAKVAARLSEVWFSDAPPDAHTKQLADFILKGSLSDNKAAIQQARTGNRIGYIIKRRLFMPYVFMKVRYPVLQKHKWLLPVYQVVRWVQMLCRGGMGRSLKELRANAEISPEQISSTADLLKALGL